ncbi:MAG: ATP-binding cassette domain-containing protein [Balneolaceae bacterium]
MILQGRNLSFSYGDETIFRQFNFSIQEGERVVIKGESGGGKSTLLRLIFGFETPDEGEILYNGDPLEGPVLREFRTQCAWLPQDLNLGRGTVADVIRFPFTFKQSVSKPPDEEQILKLFEDLGLAPESISKSFSDLSTGQRQRVGIALCILLDKPILLLDEPTSALDEESKQKAADHLLGTEHKTVISISHDPFWIDRCSRIMDLNQT